MKTLVPSVNNRLKNFLDPNVFDDFFSEWNTTDSMVESSIQEYDSEYVIEIVSPGLEKENFNIETNNNVLKVESKKIKEDENNKYYKYFVRKWNLGSHIDSSKIDAEYKNGILYVKLPKSEQSKSYQISVK